MAYYQKRRVPNRPSVEQVHLMQTLRKKLGWSDNYWHDELERRYHVKSCKNLTRYQTHEFIDYLKAEFEAAFGPLPQTAKPAKQTEAAAETAKAKAAAVGKATPERLTQRQREYIVNMWWEISRGQTPLEKQNRLQAFVKRQTGCDNLKFVTREQASAIITALEVMTGCKPPKSNTRKESVNV